MNLVHNVEKHFHNYVFRVFHGRLQLDRGSPDLVAHEHCQCQCPWATATTSDQVGRVLICIRCRATLGWWNSLMQSAQDHEPSGGVSSGGARQYMW